MASGEKFDCIVVGAGPAGTTCAYALAKAGLSTVLLERGEKPGSKNVMGGILYSTILNKVIPEFWKEAPVERRIVQKKFAVLSDDSEVGLGLRFEGFNKPPYNNTFSVLRGKFDAWYAAKAEEAGVMILNEAVVDKVIVEGKKAVGVKTRLEDGDLFADTVVVAEGVTSLLAQGLGLREKHVPEQMVTCCKEVIGLPKEAIEERFGLEGEEGASLEYFGGSVKGLVGSAFLYTNKESVSLGIGVSTHDLKNNKLTPNDIIENFKEHPSIRHYIKGGKLLEYSAHMIPEFGYDHLPKLTMDGLIIAGDAAGFVNMNPLYHEGSNLAMASGLAAAETIIEAKKNNDFSEKGLAGYRKRLEGSFVLMDLKRYKGISNFALKHPEFFKEYPELLVDLAEEFFTVSETPKGKSRMAVIKKGLKSVNLLKLAVGMNRARKVMF
ncbi:MAG TPA: FAD-dependent oxidoreductase [Candidatus Omnitrophota bacterium]|nr:FAD-dependent oxidoreductase [Candidatus Omnitrophota bacterium]HPN65975.1 FAD-dependent oxidoreductase [Candidatus Omnitrophota bacterium]